jgi:zinc protease
MGMRVFPALLYGAQHAYGDPLTGSGTEASVAKLTRDDLVKFHETWFKPNHATLIVVGDTTLAELTPKLEKLLDGWKQGDIPAKNIGTVEYRSKPVVYLLDRPGALQSVILAGEIAPPRNNPDEVGIETMNNILGGNFGARINMNLREDKHWSYGASSRLISARGQRPFVVIAPVQTDKTKESLAEINKELRGILGDKPPTAEELAKVQANETLSLPGSRETMARWPTPSRPWSNMACPTIITTSSQAACARCRSPISRPLPSAWCVPITWCGWWWATAPRSRLACAS